MPPEPTSPVERTREPNHDAWQYSLRPLAHGRWSVERGDGEAGGIFITLNAAVRFLRSDLETMVLTHEPGQPS
jgi:hypothetical protein